MKSWNYWQQFMDSGKVEDYLRYVRMEAEGPDGMARRLDAGAGQHEGIHMGDGNGPKSDAYWGVR